MSIEICHVCDGYGYSNVTDPDSLVIEKISCQRWEANITVNGKPQYLGLFKSPQEAAEAYQKKARELRGEYVPNGEAA